MTVIVLTVLGIVVGMIASHKGRSFFSWFMYGALLFPVGLTHAILLKPLDQPDPVEARQARREKYWAGTEPQPTYRTDLGVQCPKCGLMQMGRSTCKACGAALSGPVP